AAQRATAEELDDLQALVDKGSELSEEVSNLGLFIEAGLQFHAMLAGLGGNHYVGSFLSAVVDLEQHPMWTLLNAHAMQSREARHEQIAEHSEIVAAIRSRDGERAA